MIWAGGGLALIGSERWFLLTLVDNVLVVGGFVVCDLLCFGLIACAGALWFVVLVRYFLF